MRHSAGSSGRRCPPLTTSEKCPRSMPGSASIKSAVAISAPQRRQKRLVVRLAMSTPGVDRHCRSEYMRFLACRGEQNLDNQQKIIAVAPGSVEYKLVTFGPLCAPLELLAGRNRSSWAVGPSRVIGDFNHRANLLLASHPRHRDILITRPPHSDVFDWAVGISKGFRVEGRPLARWP